MKQTIRILSDKFAQYFPNTLVLPSVGNNDLRVHFQAADLEDRDEQYGFFYE